jgi:hypothetical protein
MCCKIERLDRMPECGTRGLPEVLRNFDPSNFCAIRRRYQASIVSLEVAYVWHASKFTREVLDGLLRIGFLHHQQIIWNKGRTVLTRTHY